MIAVILVSLIAGGMIGYLLSYSHLVGKIDALQNQLFTMPYQSASSASPQNDTYYLGQNVSIAQLYLQVKESVVVIQGLVPQYGFFNRLVGYSQVQGSGFVTNVTGQMVIVTNYHVVQNAVNTTVTFADGNSYASRVLGSDTYADLAVVAID